MDKQETSINKNKELINKNRGRGRKKTVSIKAYKNPSVHFTGILFVTLSWPRMKQENTVGKKKKNEMVT